MPFNSFNFWFIFPFIFGFYWLIPAKWNQLRKVFLLVASYLLYMNWTPAFALVLIGVTFVTFWGGASFTVSRFWFQDPRVFKEKDTSLVVCSAWAAATIGVQVLQLLE